MSLITKYRPNKFEDMVGNEVSIEQVKKILVKPAKERDRAFLFVGPTGCGKTTFAYMIARYLQISREDFHEYNTANTRGIDTIRDLAQTVHYSPMMSTYSLYLLDECHQLTTEAQNALLKLVEQPPAHVYFVFCTTDASKMENTLKKGRLQKFEVQLLTAGQMMILLSRIVKAEGKKDFPKDALRKITELAEGCPRDGISLLSSVIGLETDDDIMAALQQAYVEENAEVIQLCRLVASKKDGRWPEIVSTLDNIKADGEEIRYAILGYLAAILKKHPNDSIARKMEEFFDPIYDKSAKARRSRLLLILYRTTKI